VEIRDAVAWLLLAIMAGAAVVALVACARMAAANARAPRHANVRAGDYTIPYVIQLRGVRLALTIVFFVDLVLALLATRFAQGFPVLAIFSVVAPLMLWLVARYRVVLDPNGLRFRRVLAENVVSYKDLVSVAPEWATTGQGAVVVLLKLGLTQKQKPISLPLTMISARERAVIVDRLQRCAPQATFSPDLHYLWTGKF
jgi:hypothetical protein